MLATLKQHGGEHNSPATLIRASGPLSAGAPVRVDAACLVPSVIPNGAKPGGISR